MVVSRTSPRFYTNAGSRRAPVGLYLHCRANVASKVPVIIPHNDTSVRMFNPLFAAQPPVYTFSDGTKCSTPSQPALGDSRGGVGSPVDIAEKHRQNYVKRLSGYLPDARKRLAAESKVDDVLGALCFDQDANVICALVRNPDLKIHHARLIARFHQTSEGLHSLLERRGALLDEEVRGALLANPATDKIMLAAIISDEGAINELCCDNSWGSDRVVRALILNPKFTLRHAALVAEHQRTPDGLIALSMVPGVYDSQEVRKALEANPVSSNMLVAAFIAGMRREQMPKIVAVQVGSGPETDELMADYSADEIAGDHVDDAFVHQNAYKKRFAQMSFEERLERAKISDDDEELCALCFEPSVQIIIALVRNPKFKVRHARLIAHYHRSTTGLDAMASFRHDLMNDRIVRMLITMNELAGPQVMNAALTSTTPFGVANIAMGHEATAKAKQLARERVQNILSSGDVDSVMYLILESGGRILGCLGDRMLPQGVINRLYKMPDISEELASNLARWPGLPHGLIDHLLQQRSVRRNTAIKAKLLTHRNSSRDRTPGNK